LVDVDIRTSRIADIFGLNSRDGVTNVLHDNVPTRDVCQKHRGLPLTIVPAGSVPCPNPDIIATARFRAMIDEIKEQHDLVILDSPPVLAVSDPLVTVKSADATLLAVEAQNIPKPFIEQAIKVLRSVDAHLVGVVLNKTDDSNVSSGYSYGINQPNQHSHRKLPKKRGSLIARQFS
jgi:capsular exopolysaccharide synthesis family protein